jgi:RNA polymerase sigma-70 factor (ECF subfamily)
LSENVVECHAASGRHPESTALSFAISDESQSGSTTKDSKPGVQVLATAASKSFLTFDGRRRTIRGCRIIDLNAPSSRLFRKGNNMNHIRVGIEDSVAERNCRSSDRSDEDLLNAYRVDRSPRIFEQLVRRYERELYAFLRRFLGDEQYAEDTFQATFVTVHQRLDQFEEGRRFRPWLYAIATNKAIDLKRHLKRRSTVSLDATHADHGSETPSSLSTSIASREPTPFEAAFKNETRHQVSELLSQQPESMQVLLQMVFFQGMKYAEISDALGIPVGTVKSRVFNAMRKLNEAWQRMHPNSPASF